MISRNPSCEYLQLVVSSHLKRNTIQIPSQIGSFLQRIGVEKNMEITLLLCLLGNLFPKRFYQLLRNPSGNNSKQTAIKLSNLIQIGTTPLPVIVITRIITCVLRNAKINLLLPLLLGRGSTQSILITQLESRIIS